MITEQKAREWYCIGCPTDYMECEKEKCNGFIAFFKFGKKQGLIELSHLEKAKKIKETIIKLLGG